MALTYTLAGLQTILDLVDAAITGSDWAGAAKQIARANLILSGLPASAASDTQSFTLRQSLQAASDIVSAAQRKVVDNKRTIRAQTRHQTGGPGRRNA